MGPLAGTEARNTPELTGVMVALVLVAYGPTAAGEFSKVNRDAVSVAWPVKVITTFPEVTVKFVMRGDWPGGGPEPPTRWIRKNCIAPLFGTVARNTPGLS
jgi:hypothetical protein